MCLGLVYSNITLSLSGFTHKVFCASYSAAVMSRAVKHF